MSRPIIRIHNIETDQVIDREMTVAEFAEHKIGQQLDAERKAEAEAKTAQRQLILDKLGLTADEARLLLG